MSQASEQATLGGGCFWCIEAVFQDLKGVAEVTSGYAGGHVEAPTYRQVCEGKTGHAEVVRVTFDPAVISFEDILGVFFAVHDPTTKDRQGHDVGTQYRSVIFYENDHQAQLARSFIRNLENEYIFPGPIVTEIAPLKAFYPAEEYHQRFFERNPQQPYCAAVVAPKVAKFRKQYLDRLKSRESSASP